MEKVIGIKLRFLTQKLKNRVESKWTQSSSLKKHPHYQRVIKIQIRVTVEGRII